MLAGGPHFDGPKGVRKGLGFVDTQVVHKVGSIEYKQVGFENVKRQERINLQISLRFFMAPIIRVKKSCLTLHTCTAKKLQTNLKKQFKERKNIALT